MAISATATVSVTDASARGVAGLVRDAESGHDLIVARHGHPVAAVIGIARFEGLRELERDPEAGRPLLGDLIGWRKLVVGDRDWRIVWRATTDGNANTVIEIAEAWAVGGAEAMQIWEAFITAH